MTPAYWKRKFAFIWIGQFLSLLSSSIVNFAIILWLSIETGSAQVLALAAIAALLPQALIGPFTGVYIDRWNRKRTMIISDGFIALSTLLIAALFYFKIKGIQYIYILLAIRSIGAAFHMPAMQASIPLLAPSSKLTRIAGINEVVQSLCSIAGPALAALCVNFLRIEQIMLIDAAGALLACASLLFISIPNPENQENEPGTFVKEFKETFTAVRATIGMPWLFLFSVISTFCIMPISVLFPLMTLEHFKGSTFQISLIEIVWGIGMLMGGIAMGFRKKPFNQVNVLNTMYLIMGLSFTLSGMLSSEDYLWFILLTAIGGVAGTIHNSAFTAIVQLKTRTSALGRVFSMYHSVTMLPSLLGLVGTGYLADKLGLAYSFILLGVIVFMAGLVSFFIPSLWKLGKSSFQKKFHKKRGLDL